MLPLYICSEEGDRSKGALREFPLKLNVGRKRSVRAEVLVPKLGVKGVRGVLGVEMYRPPHLGQRIGSSVEEAENGRAPLGFPARRG